MPAVLDEHVERFRECVTRRLGLAFEDAKLAWLAEVLGRRVAASRKTPERYLADLAVLPMTGENGALAAELTVPETYFFRNQQQYDALIEVALPARQATTQGPLEVLSAGCATGEEPYTIAALASAQSVAVSITGMDVNPSVLARARAARYSAWSLRETPLPVRKQWFRAEGRDFVLDDGLRRAVRFEERNLADADPAFWSADRFDIVFFRNVLMYFTPEIAQAVIARIAHALKPGGYLFLGHAETLRGLSGDFHLQHTHDTFYYRRRDHLAPERSTPTTARRRLAAASVPAIEGTDAWIEAIGQASERIQALTAPGRTRPLSDSPPKPTWDLGVARQLLREERFTDALAMMQAFPPEAGRDPDVLLLRAALQTHSGRLDEAEDSCQRLLDVDELSAGAHYLLALCREGAGDQTNAVSHHQVAIYLDPSFAMPHLHLGLLAKRTGDSAAAQRELSDALVLLQREDSSRLRLFGGGFERETLMALCRTELASGGQPPSVPSRLA